LSAELREAGPDWLHALLDRLEARLEARMDKFATSEELRSLERRLADTREILSRRPQGFPRLNATLPANAGSIGGGRNYGKYLANMILSSISGSRMRLSS
jgi:hypothetical protein